MLAISKHCVPSAFTCIISFMFTGETINSPRFWENRGQKAEQINLPRTHSSEQKFEPQMPLCSHSRDWSRFFFFLKLCFSLSYREWIINYNRALCISKVPGLQHSISVGGWGRGRGCHHLGNYSCSSPCQKTMKVLTGDWERKSNDSEWKPSPQGARLKSVLTVPLFGLGVLLLF